MHLQTPWYEKVKLHQAYCKHILLQYFVSFEEWTLLSCGICDKTNKEPSHMCSMGQLAISAFSVSRHSRAAWALSVVHGVSEQTQGLQWLFPCLPSAPPGMPSDLGLNLITTKQNHLLQRTGWYKIFISPAMATGRDQGSNYAEPWGTRSAL